MVQRRATVLFPLILLLILVFFYWPQSKRLSPETHTSRPLRGQASPGRFDDDFDDLLGPENRRPQPPTRPEVTSPTPDAITSATPFSAATSIPSATSPLTADPWSDILHDPLKAPSLQFLPTTTVSDALADTTSAISYAHLPGDDDVNYNQAHYNTLHLADQSDAALQTAAPEAFEDPILTKVQPSLAAGTLAPQKIDDPQDIGPPQPGGYSTHPIDELIRRGKNAYRALKKKRAHTLEAAAKAYRQRRGRHPPPGFDRWWEFAQKKGSIIVEDFFDQIYNDIEPFWAVDPELMRETAKTWHMKVTIRNGTARWHSKTEADGSWIFDWHKMMQYLDGYLPDVDLAFNNIDESRILVPYETVQKYLTEAAKHRNIDPPTSTSTLVTEFPALAPLPFENFPDNKAHEWQDWHNGTEHWEFARLTCPPGSEARESKLDQTPDSSPYLTVSSSPPTQHTFHGFVANWTAARSACDTPQLRNIHGNFVNPRWVSVNTTLWPLFGGSKITGMNNEIILPAAKYWSSEVAYSGHPDNAATRWEEKLDMAIWRGGATGGKHNDTNWKHFQRQRFLSMMNGTQVGLTEQKLASLTAAEKRDPATKIGAMSPILPHNFPFPDPKVYPLAALKTQKTSSLGEWVSELNDGAFVHFMCNPVELSQFTQGKDCSYMNDFYTPTDSMSMPDQFLHKYLPDIDGNSYSGRWRAFLRSGSVPMKATIYTEWHDARLVPWVHFVPMHNSFADYFSILEYFAGFDAEAFGKTGPHVVAHDDAAREIAEEGRSWSNKVLRHEDMLVFVHRLVLEYARVVSDERDKMGWAGDLLSDEEKEAERLKNAAEAAAPTTLLTETSTIASSTVAPTTSLTSVLPPPLPSQRIDGAMTGQKYQNDETAGSFAGSPPPAAPPIPAGAAAARPPHPADPVAAAARPPLRDDIDAPNQAPKPPHNAPPLKPQDRPAVPPDTKPRPKVPARPVPGAVVGTGAGAGAQDNVAPPAVAAAPGLAAPPKPEVKFGGKSAEQQKEAQKQYEDEMVGTGRDWRA